MSNTQIVIDSTTYVSAHDQLSFMRLFIVCSLVKGEWTNCYRKYGTCHKLLIFPLSSVVCHQRIS